MWFFDFLDLAIETIFSSFWHFIGYYIAGFVLSAVLISISDKIEGKPTQVEKVVLCSAGSWVSVISITILFIFFVLMILGGILVMIIQHLLGLRKD